MSDPGFACPFCGSGSSNDSDKVWRFCGACGVFVDDVNALIVALGRAEDAVCVAARKFARASIAGRGPAASDLFRAVKRLERVSASHAAQAVAA